MLFVLPGLTLWLSCAGHGSAVLLVASRSGVGAAGASAGAVCAAAGRICPAGALVLQPTVLGSSCATAGEARGPIGCCWNRWGFSRSGSLARTVLALPVVELPLNVGRHCGPFEQIDPSPARRWAPQLGGR